MCEFVGKHEDPGVEHAPIAHEVILDVKPVLNELVRVAQVALDQKVPHNATQAFRQVILHL